jgi:thioredoxin
MRTKKIKNISVALFFLALFVVSSCGQNKSKRGNDETKSQVSTDSKNSEKKYKVTFIELGSVNCIPCKLMQKVMNSIETKYPNDVKLIFYDVWTEEGKPYGVKYSIAAIPTQIFLDEAGKEYFRHEGFFPEAEIIKVLQLKGVKPI